MFQHIMTTIIVDMLISCGIVIGIPFLFLGKRLIRCPDEPGRQAALICLLLVSLLANVGILTHYVLSECLILEDGQYGLSPDGSYNAHADCRNPLFASHRKPFSSMVFSIDLRDSRGSLFGQRVKVVRMDVEEEYQPNKYRAILARNLPQIVHWSADSSEVEFRVPGVRLVMKVNTDGKTGDK